MGGQAVGAGSHAGNCGVVIFFLNPATWNLILRAAFEAVTSEKVNYADGFIELFNDMTPAVGCLLDSCYLLLGISLQRVGPICGAGAEPEN